MATKQTSIVIPVYNEKDVIGGFLEQIDEAGLFHRYEFLVVDDGSDDGSSEIIGQYPVRLLRHQMNKGYGAALKTGIRHASGERVITMDSDGQHDPQYINQVNEMLEEYDLVIGERSAGSHQVRRRIVGKRLVRWIGEFLVEQKLPDYNSGYRGFKKEIIAGMLHMMPNGFSFSTTSTLAFLKDGYDVGTLEIDVSERAGRKSNVKAVRDGSKTILLIFRIIMLFNPLKVFFPASVISFLAGVGFGIAGYIFYDRFSNGAIVLTILGMFLFFIGLVADQIAIMNRRTP
ncbi:MAG TPA: glycosyltransferase family 2 protein [Bacteroides sp.]|nr:glycosyltransferase family 2 protein [Bacteroides sp.]